MMLWAQRLAGWMVALGLAAAVHADGLGGSNVPTVPIPEHLQGKFPIGMPEYRGVEQLIVLSDRWVIVVSNRNDELFKEINRLSGGKLKDAADRWAAHLKSGGNPPWDAYHGRWRICDQYAAQARENIGERRLGQVDYFRIQSPNDPAYAQPKQPAQADLLYVSSGMGRSYAGTFQFEYMIYSYLELPEPMQDGSRYVIRLGDGATVTFTYDRKTTVSRAIKVNQVGYLPDAGRKRAYLGAYLYRFGPLDLSHVDRFEVINAHTGEVAFEGKVELIEKNPRFAPAKPDQDPASRPLMYGEDVYIADFTGLREEGVFFISVPGVGRSWPFVHAADVYGPAFFTAARGYFHQRAGMAITKEYSAWTRPMANMWPFYESEHINFPHHAPAPKGYEHFDVIGATLDKSRKTEGVPGGWHDAADWDSDDHHYVAVFDMLHAYGWAPKKFSDGQLKIPESGNGVPDVLDEARFHLELYRHSMDARGGVTGRLETWTHPKINDDVDYAFGRRTRWSSLLFAAAAAQYAQHAEAFNPEDAKVYREAAARAYAFGHNPANSLGKVVINAKRNRGRGEPYTIEWEETDEHIYPFLLHAKLRMYLLTGDKQYLDGVPELAKKAHKPYQHHFSRKDYSPWIYYSIIEAADGLPDDLVDEWRQFFIRDADELVSQLADMPYAITWPRKQDYWMAWGASMMMNYNRGLMIAYHLTGDAKYRDAAIANTDFMLGANPMGMSWTTGLGFVYPIDIQHEMSEDDGIVDPVPGITIYGITGGPIYHQFRNTVWVSQGPNGPVEFVSHESQRDPPVWRRWMVHPHVAAAHNEFTVHETMAGAVFTMATLLNEGWTPQQSPVVKTAPRNPDQLFGYWYLP